MSPILLDCDRCEGVGCNRCGGQPRQRLTTSLSQWIGPLWKYVDLCRYADKGTFPVSGGVLDQTSVFLRMMDAWRTACAMYRQSDE